MKKLHRSIFIVFILVLQSCGLNEYDKSVSIYGVVSDSYDQPLSGVKIEYNTLYSVDSIFTKADGSYRIVFSRARCVYFTCSKEDYIPQIFGKTFKSGEELHHDIKLDIIP